MNTAQKASIIGLSVVSLILTPLTGCKSSPSHHAQDRDLRSVDDREPWVKRDREASLEWTLETWADSEAKRPGHLRQNEDDVRKRYQRSVEDFYEIPVTAYMMFY